MIFFREKSAPFSSKSKPAVSFGLRKTTQARDEVRSPHKHLLWPLCQSVAPSDISRWSGWSNESHRRGWHLHRAIQSNISNTRSGKNRSPLCKSLSTDHVSLRSSFSPGVYQTWHGDPPSHPATAQELLNTAHSSSLFPFPALSPTFLVMPEFAHDRELCWSGLCLIIGRFGTFYILVSLMWHESFP